MRQPKSLQEARLTPTLDTIVIFAVAILGVGLILYRWFFGGLGAVTNLSDGYPWGFWIGIDILAGIALAAGGFVMAGVVHLFGGEKFHPLARPAILTGLLGYLLFIVSLLVDLGRPWNLWKGMISWNHYSPMFEVAWCVMMYTTVMFLEFLPAVFERLKWDRIGRLWYELTPFVIIAMLTTFTFAMTGNSLFWAGVVFVITGTWEVLMRLKIMPRDKQMPLLLIMAGVMFSTMHQSSLGTLFLIMDKLGPLWHTPILPILFFISAVVVAPAMVSFEALATAWAFKRKPELDLLRSLAKGMPYLIGLYLTVRVGDMVVRGVALQTLTFSLQGLWWWLEVLLYGFALIIYTTPEMVRTARGLFIGSLAAIFGLIVHRTGVAIVGIQVPEYARYVPAWSEVMITLGILACGLIAFRLAIHYLPIYEAEEVAEREERIPEPASLEVHTVGV